MTNHLQQPVQGQPDYRTLLGLGMDTQSGLSLDDWHFLSSLCKLFANLQLNGWSNKEKGIFHTKAAEMEEKLTKIIESYASND